MSNDMTVFKTIEIGIYESAEDLRQALKNYGMCFGRGADYILNKMVLSKSKKTLDLVVQSVEELGFSEGATYRSICKEAKKRGLSLCPAEVGPLLRLQYCCQPYGEWLEIAMTPIRDSVGDLLLFRVMYTAPDHWLSVTIGRPNSFFGAGCRFVFVLPK